MFAETVPEALTLRPPLLLRQLFTPISLVPPLGVSGKKKVLNGEVSGDASVMSSPLPHRSKMHPDHACGLKYQLAGLPIIQSSTSVTGLVRVLTLGH